MPPELKEFLVWQPRLVESEHFDFDYITARSAREAVKLCAVKGRPFDHIGTLVETYLVCPIDEDDVVWTLDGGESKAEREAHELLFRAWVARTTTRSDLKSFRLEVEERTTYTWSLDAVDEHGSASPAGPSEGGAA